ncbi:MAG: prepilin-type N-terminal cleavage/methylation domain-containing protein [Candidatus Didemnitutus sp.]|nr:prepilin-type N-terminal cleavage/methylation domain-containing protein [Candidatus Didemnitutus sp.]
MRRRVQGFTLLELLVAVTLTLGMAAVMLSVTTSTLNVWRRTQDRFSTSAQAKLALDFLERDLHAGVFRADSTTTWLAVDIINESSSLATRGWQIGSVMKPSTAESLNPLPTRDDGRNATVSDARFGVSGAWLRFVSAVADSGNDGALPRAVAYHMARRPQTGSISVTNPAEIRYALYRAAVSSSTSFTNGNDVTVGYGTALSVPNVGDVILSNTVDFGVWLYVRAVDGSLRRIFPADTGDLSHVARDPGGAADANRYPDVADVMIRVLSEEGARQIAAIEQGTVARPSNYTTDAAWWWAVVETNSTVYVRRIEVKGGGR